VTVELSSHVPGTPYRYKHGWIPVNPETGRFAAQTPSQFRHPETGHAMGKSEIGDTYEALFAAKGAHLLQRKYGGPYLSVAHVQADYGGLTSRNTALDFRLDAKFGGELKTLNVNAKNQKTAIKAAEVERKNLAVARAGLRPLLVVQVVDPDNGTVHVYAYPGFVSKKVTRMDYLGTYSYTPEDFTRAQKATKHHEKRTRRAAITLARADPEPVDVEPEPGDTVIELRDGVPYIYTQPEKQKGRR
jgi:hypothetical protein